jgi:hypothetical protein
LAATGVYQLVQLLGHAAGAGIDLLQRIEQWLGFGRADGPSPA